MEKEQKILKVEFTESVAGWLYFTVGTWHGAFSCYWCPLPDLKRWLESIALGVKQASFTYEPEASFDIRFDFSPAVTGEKRIYEGKTLYDRKEVDIFTISEAIEVCAYNDLAQELYEKSQVEPLITKDNDHIYFREIVDRKQLVSAFYNALIDFFNSDKYNPKEWESRSYRGTPLRKIRSETIEKYLNKK